MNGKDLARMGMRAYMLAAMTVLSLAVPGSVADGQEAVSATQQQEELQVLDIVIVSTNQITLGTNTLSPPPAADLIERRRDAIDVVAVHGWDEGDAATGPADSAVTKIARFGLPLVVVEKDGAYQWRGQSDSDGIRTVKIGTDHVAALRRLWKKGEDDASGPAGPVLQTTIDWDTGSGSYELRRVELGLLGERVWLMHERGEAGDEGGTVGVRLKKEW